MSHIYVFSPSSAVRDRAAMRRGVARLRALGKSLSIAHGWEDLAVFNLPDAEGLLCAA